MAIFKIAFDKTSMHEGGYSNDPDDVGGETYRGISRKYNPLWRGWDIIDDCKRFEFSIEECLAMKGTMIDDLVISFYKDRYWNPWWGDDIDDQDIANEMFDTSVNMGVSRAIEFLQKSLNYLNRNGKIYADIVEDGAFGKNTFRAYNSLPKKDRDVLYKMMNVLQGMHYMNYMSKSPIQEKYARGWFNRVDFIKRG
jgi:lysozyme family protein